MAATTHKNNLSVPLDTWLGISLTHKCTYTEDNPMHPWKWLPQHRYTNTHTHCWEGKSIISPSSTDCCPSKLCYIDLKKFSVWLSVTGITASWLRWEQTVPVQPLYPSRWLEFLLGLSDTRISQQPSNTAVEAPLTLREQVPILLGKGEKWNFHDLFIHSWKGTNKDKSCGVRVLVWRPFMNE